MTGSARESLNLRALILAPTGKDAWLAATAFREAAVDSFICTDIAGVARAFEEGAGALLIAEEAIAGRGVHQLADIFSRQPPWSDLPVLLLTRHGADSPTVADALRSLDNITLLERPVRPAALISAVRTALKARERQYQIRAHLAERQQREESLREADRCKDEFLATLAHELRNPLAPIRNSIHILRMFAAGDPGAEQVCQMLERQVGHLVRLVDDLLEVSRITRGKVELRFEPIELAAVIRSAVETSRPLIDAAGHQLAISLPPQPLVVEGDSIRLSQVFSNILNNAAKYMNEGGQIWLQARRQGDDIVVSVRDTGIGIPADLLPQIFNMFTQVDRSGRRAQGGLGIGLTLVRMLVQMHGGQVTASSPGVDQGSEFVVTLPLSKQTTVAAGSPSETQTPTFSTARFLVVDDNRDAAHSLGLLLKVLGADVQVANDGPSALELLPSFRPTVVLLDIGMPGMDGYEVARRMRQHALGKELVLIALTGWGQEEDRRRTSQAGFDHHLIKPADLSVLKSLL